MATQTTTQTETTTSPSVTSSSVSVKHPILFIIFAEFLGYESPLIEWAEKYCKGKDIPSYQKHILVVDGNNIFKRMQTQYTLEQIKMWWDKFEPVILEEYAENIAKLELDETSDLPF